jgi:hypothetical protein
MTSARPALAACLLLALPLLSRPARADPPFQPIADPSAIYTFQDENASISTSNLPDRYYVNGALLGYVSPTGDMPDFVSNFGHALWGDGLQRISIDLSQLIFTPANTQAKPPPSTDRPYAGVLTGDFALLQDTTYWRSIFDVQLGLVGPGAGAQEVQNGFHSIIGQSGTKGWQSYQIPNEPVGEITSERVWRLPTGQIGGLETDVLPDLTAGVGNLRIYGLAGGIVRIGQGLDSDYGVDRIRPGMSGGNAFTPVRPFDWYVFAGADGQAVGYDATITGVPFQPSPSVPITPFVGEFEAGFAVMFDGVRLSYTQVFQTAEFAGQRGGLHQFGSFAASIHF